MKYTKFEDFINNIEEEDYLDNSRKTPFSPGSYKDIEFIKNKEKGKTKSKKRRINTILGTKMGNTGVNVKDAQLWFNDDY